MLRPPPGSNENGFWGDEMPAIAVDVPSVVAIQHSLFLAYHLDPSSVLESEMLISVKGSFKVR
jgi:hypothetical protein